MMAYTFTVQADTCEEFRSKLLSMAKLVGAELIQGPATDPNQLALPITDAQPLKRGRGKPPKPPTLVDEPEVKSEHSVSDIKAATEAPAKIDFLLVKAAVKRVADAKGLEKAQDVVKQFGAERVSAVKEADFAMLIQACDLALV